MKEYKTRKCVTCGTLINTKNCAVCVKRRNDEYRKINKDLISEAAKKRYHENPDGKKKQAAEWRLNNKEKMREMNANWRLANKEKVKISSAIWYEKNKEMVKSSARAWYSENKEKAAAINKESQRKYRSKNREKIRLMVNKRYAENPIKGRERSEEYRIANPEKAKAAVAAYRAANPEKMRIYCQNRRARRLLAGGRLSKNLSEKLFKLQKGKCACCKKPLKKNYHLDHITPLALGGANEDWNIQLLTQHCNGRKHAKDPIEFMRSMGFLI